MALKRLEAAAQHNPFDPQGTAQAPTPAKVPMHVAGRGWLLDHDTWLFPRAAFVVMADLQQSATVANLDVGVPANLRRMAVATSTLRCALRSAILYLNWPLSALPADL